MSDSKDKSSVPVESKEVVTESRRRFAKTGLAGGAVLMSLSGRSAFGSGGGFTGQCSVDTLFSVYNGGSKYDFDATKCEFGCTPGFWSDPGTGGSGGVANNAAWDKITSLTGWSQATLIEVVFDEIGNDDSLITNSNNKLKGRRLDSILENPVGSSFVKQSVRHALAAVLDSVMMGFYYSGSYMPQDIIDLFNSAWANYRSAPGNSLYQSDLESIHQTFKALNERSCPLGVGAGEASDPGATNPFFNDEFRQKINL